MNIEEFSDALPTWWPRVDPPTWRIEHQGDETQLDTALVRTGRGRLGRALVQWSERDNLEPLAELLERAVRHDLEDLTPVEWQDARGWWRVSLAERLDDASRTRVLASVAGSPWATGSPQVGGTSQLGAPDATA